ncbi:MAG TPA: hypothetical protein VEH84_07260 [Alphaproteobacteria bacterium]|nr:hypothetical protein [Alphaproteobacteria bacterium]
MRKFLISAAVAATALTAAAPASAQWAPPPPYGAPYGHAYGYDNYGQARRLQVRLDHIQRQIRHLDRRNILTNREAARLFDDSREIERRLHRAARFGLNGRERFEIERRIARLEQRLWRDARDGNRWGDRRYGDRDHDGRFDRWEDDRGRDRDD